MSNYKVLYGDCLSILSEKKISQKVDVTFLDPPFNQDKEYSSWNDKLPDKNPGIFSTTYRLKGDRLG